jgi:hypothetical protein
MAASNTRFTQNSLGQSKNLIDSDHGIYRDHRPEAQAHRSGASSHLDSERFRLPTGPAGPPLVVGSTAGRRSRWCRREQEAHVRHEAARVHNRARRRGGVAARGACAAAEDDGDRSAAQWITRCPRTLRCGVPAGAEGLLRVSIVSLRLATMVRFV